MAVYWRAKQIPELRSLPADVREELVEAAMLSVPLTFRALTIAAAVVVLWSSVFLLSVVWDVHWLLRLFALLSGAVALYITVLNLALPHIREYAANSRANGASRGPEGATAGPFP